MRVTKGSIAIGRTVNLGNYESLRMEISAEVSLSEGESLVESLNILEKGVKKDLDARIKKQVEALRG